MREPVRPVVEGDDALDAVPRRPRRGPIDPALLRVAPALRRHLVVCAALATCSTVVVLVQAEVLGRGLPRLVDGDLGAAVPTAAALASVAVARLLLRWATEVSASRAAAGARASITERVVGHALVVDEPGSTAAAPARVTTLVTDGIDALDPWIRTYVPALCIAGILPLAAGARILAADVQAALILLVAIPLIPVFMVLIGKLAEDRADRQWATLQRLAGHFHEVLVGLPTLRLFGQSDAEVGRVRAVAEQYRVAVMRTLRVAFLSAAAMELLSMLSIALVAVTIGYRLSIGAVTLQTALVVLVLAPECSLPIRRVGAAFHAAQAGTDAADEVQEVLGASTTPDGPVASLPPASAGDPVLEVSGATVVDPVRGHRVGPVDLSVDAGTLVALVGSSGAGKTTLLDAVRGRVPLQRGSIALGGTDVGDLSRTARDRAVSWIPQHPDPVGSEVRTAIAAADTGEGADLPDPVAVDEALCAVDLDGMASRRPAELSGGERRRVAVARALLRCRPGSDVRVLLADEPTSHLDPSRRALVVASLRRIADSGPAVVVATHDPIVVEAADLVVAIGPPVGPAVGDARLDGEAERFARGSHAPGADPPIAEDAERPDARDPGAPWPVVRIPDRDTPEPAAAHLPPEPAAGSSGHDELTWFRRMGRMVRWRLVGARVIGIGAEVCTVGLAGTAAWMLVRASQGFSFSDLAVAVIAVRTFALAKGALRYLERIVSHDATFRLLAEVRARVVDRLARIAPGGVADMERGDVMARVVDDVDRLADQELRVTGPMVSGVAVGLGAIAGAALAAPAFGAAYAVVVAVVAIAMPAVSRRVTSSTVSDRVAARSELAGATLGLVEHGDELTATGTASSWQQRISDAVAELGRVGARRGMRMGVLEGVAAASAPLLAAAVVLLDRGTGGRVDGAVLGVLVLVPFALSEVLAPLLHAGEQESTVLASATRLRAVLDAAEPVAEPEEPAAVPADPAVSLVDVDLRWPGTATPAVTAFGMHLEPGARLRVEGPSGSGKSTVAAALVRFIELDAGHYLLDDVDARNAAGDDIRGRVTWCQQSPWLATASIRENLLLAAPDAEDDDLWAALDAVALSEWAIALPEGLSTGIGRDGSAMSGGQRQRLALARVLLAGHRVVVLDEPTAHLDATTARRVLTDMHAALEDRSVVMLAHPD